LGYFHHALGTSKQKVVPKGQVSTAKTVASCAAHIKPKQISRVERFDGAAVPLYYFEAEGPGWSDYRDDDGIELLSDAKALAYAHTMIGELKADREGSNRPLHLLVKNAARKTVFRIAFE
jgi:uncharacterized protein DUF6894